MKSLSHFVEWRYFGAYIVELIRTLSNAVEEKIFSLGENCLRLGLYFVKKGMAMMGKLLVGEREFNLETRCFHCKYYVLVDMVEKPISMESYGVGILLTETGERVFVSDITPSEKKIISFGELLYRNSVTPCTLMDILADWL